MKRGRQSGDITRGSVVYLLSALHRVPRVLIPCGADVTRMMKTINAHFLRSPSLKEMKYRQHALYCVQPGNPNIVHVVMVERVVAAS